MKISAVIFDLDGTVLDNEDEYGIAFRKVLKNLGRKVDKKYPHIGGIGVKENWPILLSKYHIKTDKSIEELTKETQDAYLSQLSRVDFKKGTESFINDLKNAGIKVALATSNAWWIVEEVSDALPLDKLFDVTTTGEEVEFKKPDPDLFLITAQKLGVEPPGCLVIEDSQAGVEAAQRAGMKVIGITDNPKHTEVLKNADMVIKNYYETSPEKLKSL